MSRWRNSKNQAKQLGRPQVFVPGTHNPERAMWRDLGSLLEHRNAGSDSETVPRLTLEWLGHLHDEDLLAKDHPIVLPTIGMTYGAQSPWKAGWSRRRWRCRRLLGVAARGVALTAVERADAVGEAVGQLTRNLGRAALGRDALQLGPSKASACRSDGEQRPRAPAR